MRWALSKRRLIVGSVVFALAVVLGVLYGYLAGVAVVILAVLGLMVVYMRGHMDVLTSPRSPEERVREQVGFDKDDNR
jgi:uncharacterized membrane protein YphA (DoxX/SURF4 family)